MPLNDLEIRNAKASDRLRKLSDGGGLQLWITPGRGKEVASGLSLRGSAEDAGNRRLSGNCFEGSPPPETRQSASQLAVNPSVAKKFAKAARAQAVADTFEAIAADSWTRSGARKSPIVRLRRSNGS